MGTKGSVPEYRKKAPSIINNNIILIWDNKISIDPYYIDKPYPITLDTHTFDSDGQLIESIPTIRPNDRWLIEDDIKELINQLSQSFVKLEVQPNSKLHLGFCCHIGKPLDTEYESEDLFFRLELKQVKIQKN